MLKKYFSLIICLMFVCCGLSLSVSASEVITDEATGVDYTLLYSPVTVGGSYEVSFEYSINGERRSYFWEYVDGELTGIHDPRVQEKINQCINTGEKKIRAMTSESSNVILCPLMNQEEYTVPEDRLPVYYRFLGVDETFTGVKVVEKKGIPFTVTGDGSGALTLQIKTDLQGKYTEQFFVPSAHTLSYEKTVAEDYSVVIIKKGTDGINDILHFPTLEELLVYCAENAELNKPLNIKAKGECFIKYTGEITSSYIIELEYGNKLYTTAGKPTSAPTAAPEPDPTSQVITSDTTESAVQTTVTTTTTMTTTTVKTTITKVTTKATVTTTTTKATTKASATTTTEVDDEPKNETGNAAWGWIVLGSVAALAVGGGAFWYFRFFRPKKQGL